GRRALPHPRARSGRRQHRAFLWRRHLHRHRLDPAHQGLPRSQRRRRRTVSTLGVGDPHRLCCARNPHDATFPAGPQPEAAPRRTSRMITLEHAYLVAGIFFAVVSVLSALDASNARRAVNTLFWGSLAISFLFGSKLSDLGNGMLALALVAVGVM